MKKLLLFVIAILLTATVAMAAPPDPLTISTDPGADSFTDSWRAAGPFNISISGATWVGTVTIQRSYNEGGDWVDVATFTSNIETAAFEPAGGGRLWRIGMKDGGYTSGAVTMRLDQ